MPSAHIAPLPSYRVMDFFFLSLSLYIQSWPDVVVVVARPAVFFLVGLNRIAKVLFFFSLCRAPTALQCRASVLSMLVLFLNVAFMVSYIFTSQSCSLSYMHKSNRERERDRRWKTMCSRDGAEARCDKSNSSGAAAHTVKEIFHVIYIFFRV